MKETTVETKTGGDGLNWLERIVSSSHRWTKWKDVKTVYAEIGGQYKIIQERRCLKTGKVQVRSSSC